MSKNIAFSYHIKNKASSLREKVSVFVVFAGRYSVQIRKMRTRKTPNTDTFHAFYISMPNEETRKISCYVK